MPRTFTWTDVLLISERLEVAHPDADVNNVRFMDLHKWVCALDGFAGDPKKSNEQILEAIQAAWLDERD